MTKVHTGITLSVIATMMFGAMLLATPVSAADEGCVNTSGVPAAPDGVCRLTETVANCPSDCAPLGVEGVFGGATKEGFAGTAGLGQRDLISTIGGIIRVLLSFLGIVAVLLILYAGFLWMTSGGESTKADKAKTLLIQAVIGLIIILSAFALAEFVISRIVSAGAV